MPTPPMYNQPHGQSNLMPHGPNYGYQQQPQPQSYAGDDRRPGPPAGYTSHPPPPPQSISVTGPPEESPQPPHQPLPINPNVHISPPPQPDRRPHDPPPPAPMEPRTGQPERPPQPPLLNTDSAIKKMSRKSHSIFTPIEENRSILSQHLASFAAEPQGIKADRSPPGAARAHSIDAAGPGRNGAPRSSPPHPPPRPRSAQNGVDKKPEAFAPPENSPTPPSRSNSLKTGSSASANRTRGPRLKVQIPDEGSDTGNATGESTTPKAHSDPSSSQVLQRHNSHSSIVLPPPSPSASALLSAGATGPPNPFARPPPQQAVNGDTPVSSLPSRFMNSEFLPSPSSFYHDWNFRGSDNNTLPSPLNFATPVVGSGPSFLRDDNSANHANTSNAGPAASSTSAAAPGAGSGPVGESGPAKRKSPGVSSGGAADSHDVSSDAKRVKAE
jgi:MADS-box transcription factor